MTTAQKKEAMHWNHPQGAVPQPSLRRKVSVNSWTKSSDSKSMLRSKRNAGNVKTNTMSNKFTVSTVEEAVLQTARARSALYGQVSDKRPLGTHQAFQRFAAWVPRAAKAWLQQLDSVESDQIATIIGEVPNLRMTKISKAFTVELLEANRQQLLKANL